MLKHAMGTHECSSLVLVGNDDGVDLAVCPNCKPGESHRGLEDTWMSVMPGRSKAFGNVA